MIRETESKLAAAAAFRIKCRGQCLDQWLAENPQSPWLRECPHAAIGVCYCYVAGKYLHDAAMRDWYYRLDTRPNSPADPKGIKFDRGSGNWIPAFLVCRECGWYY